MQYSLEDAVAATGRADFMEICQAIRDQRVAMRGQWPEAILPRDMGGFFLAQALHLRGLPIHLAAIYVGRFLENEFYRGTCLKACSIYGHDVLPLPEDKYGEIPIGRFFYQGIQFAEYYGKRRVEKKRSKTTA